MKKFYRLLSAMLLVFVALNVQAQLDTVFYYNFNETLADFSSNGNDLTALGTDANPVYGEADGVANKGKYLDLSGNTDNAAASLYVQTPKEIFNAGTGAYTLTGWAKIKSEAGRMQIASQPAAGAVNNLLMKWANAAVTNIGGAAHIVGNLNPTDPSKSYWIQTKPTDLFNWFHFAITMDYENDAINFYYDGAHKTGATVVFPDSSAEIYFGALPAGNEANDGALDELYLFKGVLTLEQIISVMNSSEQTITIPVSVTGVELDQTTATIDVDATVQLTATVSPADASDKSLTWSSSADAIATVNNSGLVTGVAEGTATITVTTNDGDFTATADITVDATTAIKAVTADNFTVYPNPVKENLFIDGGNIHSATLYSITGSAVMYIEDGISEGIDVTSIKSGIYFLKVANDQGFTVKKIMKE